MNRKASIAEDLLQAAERIDEKHNGCCHEILTEEAKELFKFLFHSDIEDFRSGLESEIRGSWIGWMYVDSEHPSNPLTNRVVQDRRVLALLLTREIYLSEQKKARR